MFSLSLDVQAQDEEFDKSLLTTLESDVVPHLGDPRLPDTLVSELARLLHRGSQIYALDDEPLLPVSTSVAMEKIEPIGVVNVSQFGTTELGQLLPRERFSYWCFDLLFLISSSAPDSKPLSLSANFKIVMFNRVDQDFSRKRLAALSLPSLLNRCRSVLVGYVADESLRGNIPFPRYVFSL